jgi:hypothetical protein
MSTVAVVAIVVAVVLVALAVGGMLANARWRRATADRFDATLDEVNRQLAAAHAQDKGWEPAALESAAREAFLRERPSARIRAQALVEVIDRPGTDEDRAVFRFHTEEGVAHLTLGRAGGEWRAESLS